MTPPGVGRPAVRSERELVEVVGRYLAGEGFRVYVDPDGQDYFDLVARRAGEIGLVEVKVRDARAVLAQALRRRAWGDWSAVALGSARSAERLVGRTSSTRAAPVGVWSVGPDTVRVHRAARRWRPAGGDDPYAALRERFRRWLDQVDEIAPDGSVHFRGVPGEVRRLSGGRSFSEWRLDEPPAPGT